MAQTSTHQGISAALVSPNAGHLTLSCSIRLPRRYSNDKHRDTSAPIVGTSGSTPLHFAAANGHSVVVSTLLLHGAHAHRSDKHGVTPEMLARQNGWLECADLLRAWLLNKDKDLREREVISPSLSVDVAEGATRRKLPVKRSIDNAFNKFKPDAHSRAPITASPPPSSRNHLDSLLPTPKGDLLNPPVDRVSEDFQKLSPPHKHIAVPSGHSFPQRPRSAGTGAEPPHHPSAHTRRLGTKYSLLHLFKKSQATGDVSASGAGLAVDIDPPYPHASSFASASVSALPIQISQSSTLSTSPTEGPLSASSLNDYSSGSYPSHYSAGIHRAMAQQHARVRSISSVASNGGNDGDDIRLSNLLRSHNRSSSQGQSHAQLGSRSILHFGSASSSNLRNGTTHLRQDSNTSPSLASRLKSSCSSNSLRRTIVGLPDAKVPQTAPVHSTIFGSTRITSGDEDDEEYGSPLEHPSFTTDESFGSNPQSGAPPRGHSLSSSSSSLSQGTVGDAFVASSGAKFASNTHTTQPSSSELNGHLLAVPSQTVGPDNRARGDSISSLSTDGSINPQLSSSSTTATSRSSIKAPGTADMYLTLSDGNPSSPTSKPNELTPPELGIIVDDYVVSPHRLSLGHRRSHTPHDIDIHSISSHAQAEALVQQAQRSIFEMADQLTLSDEPLSAGLSPGRTPLSAKLAAYGESLAIQRKLKQEEEEKTVMDGIQSGDDGKDLEPLQLADGHRRIDMTTTGLVEGDPSGRLRTGRSRLDRQTSLEQKPSVGSRTRIRVPKRPNTSGGTSAEREYYPIPRCPVRLKMPPLAPRDLQSRSASACGMLAVDTKLGSPLKPIPSPLPDALEEDGPHQATRILETDDLCQVTSLPSPEPFSPSVSERVKGGQARHIASANKLTRMGFASPDGRQTSTTGSGSPRSLSGNKVMFGGLKTLMQSLKGRS